MLLEGSSIRATARTVGSHKKTVSDLSKHCRAGGLNVPRQASQNLELEQIELDEVWAFLYAKQRNVPKLKRPREAGDLWTWIAFCPDTKLVVSWRVGDRTVETAMDFLADLESRLAGSDSVDLRWIHGLFGGRRKCFRG